MDLKRQEVGYTKAQFEDYKKRLYHEIVNDGISADDVERDGFLKLSIANYVEKEIVGREARDKILGEVSKFTLMEIANGPTAAKIIYPIVNVHKGHFLDRTIYFSNINGTFTVKTVPVIPLIIRI